MFMIVLLLIYVPASFNEAGLVCVRTNLYGEHWFEFILFSAGFLAFVDFLLTDAKKSNTNAYKIQKEKE